MRRIGIILSIATILALTSAPYIFSEDSEKESKKPVSACCVSKCSANKEKCGECIKENCKDDKKCTISAKKTGCKSTVAKNDMKSEKKGSCGVSKLSCPKSVQ